MNFKIDDEFEAYLPPQTPEETAALTKKILVENPRPGSLVVAVLPEGRFLIDGHNTLAICKANKITLPEEAQVVLADREAVFAWMRANQLARRNLTSEQRAYFIGKEYEFRKKPQGEVLGKICTLPPGGMAEKMGEEQKVSTRTIKNNAKFAAGVDKISATDPEAKAAILSGKSKMTKAKVIAAGKTDAPKVRCERCTRLNRWLDDCPQCEELRDAKKPTKKKPVKGTIEPLRNGEVTFNQNQHLAAMGVVWRQVDVLYRSFGKLDRGGRIQRDTEYDALDAVFVAFSALFDLRRAAFTRPEENSRMKFFAQLSDAGKALVSRAGGK